MKLSQIVLIVALSAVTAFAVGKYTTHAERTATAGETAFDRVTRTNTLRCGYATATPWFMTDPTTKKHYGVGYEITNAVADKIGLKVDWVEETDWGLAEQGLITNRYDMLCGSVCIDPKRARVATFSTPFLHIPVLATVREGDHRFDASLKSMNDPSVRIGVKNGHIFEFIANEQFPLAQKVYANNLSDDGEFLQMLKFNKIDVAFSGQTTIDAFNEKNPEGKTRSLDEPVRFCNGAFMLPLGDERLKNVVDNAIGEINSSGLIKTILNKFVKDDPRYVRTPALLFRNK
ncbi:MAG: transporter substrate-binding domain-containing protein [Bdellovibrionales bacterium]|jgi:ABC-type amino acid transport substrate-binding protein